MVALFSDLPEAIENTIYIAKDVHFVLEKQAQYYLLLLYQVKMFLKKNF